MRLIFISLLLLSLPAWGANHTVSPDTSTLNCTNFNGGVQPGDTLVLSGTSRGPLKIMDCYGTASNPIRITNDPTENGRLTIASAGNPLLICSDCIHVVVDGTRPWAGRPAGAHCGNTDAFKTSNAGCGIKLVNRGGDGNLFHIAGWSRNMTVKGVWIDGNGGGIGLQINDHSKCQAGCSTTSKTSCWKENFLVENNVIEDVHGEGMYIGPNWDSGSCGTDVLRTRNNEVRNNWVFNTGRDGINLKSCIRSDCKVHHNYLTKVGTRTDTAGQPTGISMFEGGGYVYANYIKDAGEHGINCSSWKIPEAKHPELRCDIFNNIISGSGAADGGVIADGRGIRIDRRAASPSRSDWSFSIHQNTIANSEDDGIEIGSNIGGATRRIQDNITCGSRNQDIDDASGGKVANNMTGSCSAMGFIAPAAADYQGLHLKPESPAVNRVSSALTSEDIDGDSRPAGSAAVGADEYATSRPVAPLLFSEN